MYNIIILLYPLYILSVILITSFIFYKYIYTDFKIKSSKTDLSELLVILNAVINTELDLYERNIFSKKGAITNSNFENFYNDIVNSIINSLSKDFFFRINFYIKEEAVVSIICRTVKIYLTEKINGTV